jgi:hypothetical protein
MNSSWRVPQIALIAAYRFILHLPREKQAVEMTECGKHGKP